MAFDAFLKFEPEKAGPGGIGGDSTVKGYEKWITVDSWSFGVSNASSGPKPGTGAGKANFQDLSITKRQSSATIPLLLACASGQVLRSGQLDVVASGRQGDYVHHTIKLTNVVITQVNEVHTAGEGPPVDQFSCSYDVIEWSHSTQDAKGAVVTSSAGWDLKAAKKV